MTEMTIDVLRHATSRTHGGVSRPTDLRRGMTATDGGTQVPLTDGTIATGAEGTTRTWDGGVDSRRGPRGVDPPGAAGVGTTGEGMTGHAATISTGAIVTQIDAATSIVETATETAGRRRRVTGSSTEGREITTGATAKQTGDRGTEILTAARREEAIATLTAAHHAATHATSGLETASTTDATGTSTVVHRETEIWTATAAGREIGTSTGPVREIVRGILTDRATPTTGRRATTGTMTEAAVTTAGSEIGSEIGVLMSVVRLPVTTGEAKASLRGFIFTASKSRVFCGGGGWCFSQILEKSEISVLKFRQFFLRKLS